MMYHYVVEIEDLAARVCLNLNAKNAKYISFNSKRNTVIETRNGPELELVNDFKYLGLMNQKKT